MVASEVLAITDGLTWFEQATIILTLIALDAALSFDNAAVLAAMVRHLPAEQRRKALLYGLAGAYGFRIAAIALVSYIIQYAWLGLAGGIYLVALPARHFVRHARAEPPRPMRIPGLSAFWTTVVAVELTDIAFAVDNVVAAVGLTEEFWLIVVAILIAILFLRLAAIGLSRLMDWAPGLEHAAYMAVGVVGLRMLAEHAYELVTGVDRNLVPDYALGIATLGILLTPLAWKWLRQRRQDGPAQPAREEP